MDYSGYLDPNFDPASLRVVDLKKVLDDLHVDHPTRLRKADLVQLFTDQALPKIRARYQSTQIKSTPDKVTKPARKKVQKTNPVQKSPSKESKQAIEKLLESQRTPRVKSLKNPFLDSSSPVIPAKRKNVEEGSPVLKKALKHESPSPTTPEVKKPRKTSTRKTSTRKTSTRKTSTRKTSTRKSSKTAKSTVTPKKAVTPIKTPGSAGGRRSSFINKLWNPTNDIKLESGSESESEVDQKRHKPLPEAREVHRPSYRSPRINRNRSYSGSTPDSRVSTPIQTPRDYPLPRALSSARQLSFDVSGDSVIHHDTTYHTAIQEESAVDVDEATINNALNSTPEETYSDIVESSSDEEVTDQTIFEQLQHDLRSEASAVEKENKKLMKVLHKKKVPFTYRLLPLIALALAASAFYIWREEQIAVGFCGHETFEPVFNTTNAAVTHIEEWLRPECVPCPENGICDTYSVLKCKPDFTLSPTWLSILAPTFDTCVLDADKLRKVTNMVRVSTDLLAQRNADYNCGTGTDADVGLSFDTLENYLIQGLNMEEDAKTGEFNYLWEKAVNEMETNSDLVFEHNYVRSNSLKKLTLKCRLKRKVVDVLIRIWPYLAGFGFIAIFILIIYYKVQKIQKQRHQVKDLSSKALEKLQKQAKLFREGIVPHRYIGKIQLRDYFLSDPSMSRKSKNIIWEQVSKNVERNTNVHAYSLEVAGDIMKVWEWTTDM